MAWVSFKKDLNKVYSKIDKIAKKGRDNFQEYYNYVDNLIQNSSYGILTQVLIIKYDFDYTRYLSVNDIKRFSWTQILFRTQTNFEDGMRTLLNETSLYRIGLDVYLENIVPYARVIDPGISGVAGTGADIKLVISDDSNRGVIRIDVLNQGKNYSTASYIQVYGGSPSATASAYIRGGFVLRVDMGGSGSNHGLDVRLGSIQEVDRYVESIDPLTYTNNLFQQITDNKVTYLVVDKVGYTMSASFSTWNFDFNYDKNLLNLYQEAFNYLI